MPKCKICGEAVQSGEVMHVECREKWEKKIQEREDILRAKEMELEAKMLELREREEMLDMREKAQDFREGFLDFYYEEILAESKKAKRFVIFGIALAVLTIVLSLLNLMM